MKPRPSPSPGWLRVWTVALAIASLLWIQLEDLSPQRAILFASAANLTVGLHAWIRAQKNPCHRLWLRYPLGSASLGIGTPLLAMLFMLFKSGLHGHGFPDYSIEDYLDILRLTPAFGAIGLAIGIGISSWLWQRCSSERD